MKPRTVEEILEQWAEERLAQEAFELRIASRLMFCAALLFVLAIAWIATL